MRREKAPKRKIRKFKTKMINSKTKKDKMRKIGTTRTTRKRSFTNLKAKKRKTDIVREKRERERERVGRVGR